MLARWGIKKLGWNWDMENNDVSITFQIVETLPDGKKIAPIITIGPPKIYHQTSKRNPKETINWPLSMRLMYWYVKSHLEMAYLMQTSKAIEFLPYVQVSLPTGESKKLGDKVSLMAKSLPMLEENQ